MKILNQNQISQKVKRLSYEIMENNFNESEIFLVGINNNGSGFAKMLLKELKKVSKTTFHLCHISINPADPTKYPVELDIDIDQLNDKVVIIVDDVANTGRTLFYALKPLLQCLPKKVEMVVLVDRKHKSFPITPDYVGLSLATTLQENIDVKIGTKSNQSVFLN